jgi:hypothetical protein
VIKIKTKLYNLQLSKLMSQSKLGQIIISRLPHSYLLFDHDYKWIDIAATYWDGKEDNKSIVDAFKEANEKTNKNCEYSIDPFELLVDADICDENVISK